MAKVLATFRIEEDDWNAFKTLADSRGSNASSELVKFIQTSLGRIEDNLETVSPESLDKRIENYLEINLDNLLGTKIELAINSLRGELQPILNSQKDFNDLRKVASLSQQIEALEAKDRSLRQRLTTLVTDDEDESQGMSKSSLNAIFFEGSEGLSDAQLAKTLGVNSTTVNRWRNGKAKPKGNYENIFDNWEVKSDRWYRL